jgi:hypothetical protein
MVFVIFATILVLAATADTLSASCCVGITGNVNGDQFDQIDISDLTYLVAYLFQGGPPPPCQEEVDMNGSGQVDVSDLTYLVEYLFLGGPPPVPCP